jgi:DNA polymerase
MIAKFKAWVAEKGVFLDGLDKESVLQVLREDIPADVRRALEIRQSLGKSSVAKYASLLGRCCPDCRVRSTLLFCGAGTGRWAGRGFQPQNLPSRGLCLTPEFALWMITEGATPEDIYTLFGDPMWVASSAVRSVVVAGPNKKLVAVDLASIEGRVLAWLAGEAHTLEAYRRREDLYKLAAMSIYHLQNISEVTKKQRQIGKVAELALGYQGGVGAFTRMAEAYGVYVPEDEAAAIVRAWRAARPATVRFWREIEKAAMIAVKNPGQIVTHGKIAFRMIGGFLVMRLPSSRCVRYPLPYIGKKKLPWLDENGYPQQVPALWFWGINATTNQWERQSTYGGCLTENIVQAISRDIMAEGLTRVAAADRWDIVLHVHDEGVAECDKSESLEDFMTIFLQNPSWCQDLPIAGEGWEGERYRK